MLFLFDRSSFWLLWFFFFNTGFTSVFLFIWFNFPNSLDHVRVSGLGLGYGLGNSSLNFLIRGFECNVARIGKLVFFVASVNCNICNTLINYFPFCSSGSENNASTGYLLLYILEFWNLIFKKLLNATLTKNHSCWRLELVKLILIKDFAGLLFPFFVSFKNVRRCS